MGGRLMGGACMGGKRPRLPQDRHDHDKAL